LGYRGLFGVDMMTYEGRAEPVDLNPRFQGSTLLLACVEQELNLPSTTQGHLSAFGAGKPGLHGRPVAYSSVGDIWIQLYFKCRQQFSVTGVVAAGVYSCWDERLVRHGPWHPCAKLDGEKFALFDVPPMGSIVKEGALLGKVVARCSSPGLGFVETGRRIQETLALTLRGRGR
jgi:hypothetical protein